MKNFKNMMFYFAFLFHLCFSCDFNQMAQHIPQFVEEHFLYLLSLIVNRIFINDWDLQKNPNDNC